MKKIELYCKKCNHKLTKEPLAKMDADKLNNNDDEDLLPKGFFTLNNNFTFDVEITYLVNWESIDLYNHSDGNRFSGCCGPSVMSKYNQVCPNCSEELGVELSDCWLPHLIGISKEKTSTKPIW